jgi:hypothetical protein
MTVCSTFLPACLGFFRLPPQPSHTCYRSQLEIDLQFVRGQLDTETRLRDRLEQRVSHLTQKHQAVDKSVYESLQVRAVHTAYICPRECLVLVIS